MSNDRLVAYPPFETDANGNPIFAFSCQQQDGSVPVAQAGREGDEMIVCSHNFCDPTTWYSTSGREVEEVFDDSGDGLTFELPSGSASKKPWIDLAHGKVLWEDDIASPYALVVTVDDVAVTEDPMYGSAGDYTADYVNGTITFHSSQAGNVVKVTYSHSVSSEWILRPTAGKVAVLEDSEIQFSADLSYDDCLRVAPWGYAGVFAPDMVPPLEFTYLIELTPRVRRYKRHDQILDEARGAYPVIGTIGGIGGCTSERFGYPLIYKTVTELHSAYGMELRVSLENNYTMGGERATVTFYGIWKDEA